MLAYAIVLLALAQFLAAQPDETRAAPAEVVSPDAQSPMDAPEPVSPPVPPEARPAPRVTSDGRSYAPKIPARNHWAGSTGRSTGLEAHYWDGTSVIVGRVLQRRELDASHKKVTLQMFATLGGRFDPTRTSEVEIIAERFVTDGVLGSSDGLDKCVVAVISEVKTKPTLKYGEISLDPIENPALYMNEVWPKRSSFRTNLVVVSGLGDPKVTELADHLRKLRSAAQEPAK